MLAIGVNDLTAELGVPGRYDDPRVRDAVATAARACQRHGKLLMVGGIADLAILDDLAPLGVCPLQLTGTDTELLFTAAAARAAKFTGGAARPRTRPVPIPARPRRTLMTEILQTTPMRPAETNTRPRFTLPARACDAHFHVFEPGFPHVPDPLYTFPDGTLEQYLRMTERARHRADGAGPADLLRHRQPAARPRCSAASARAARGVVRIEEDTSDADLDRYHDARCPGDPARPVRPRDPGRPRTSSATCGGWRPGPRPRGWHLQFYTPGTVVRDLLPFLADLEDPFVIDHMGYMLEADGLTQADFDRLLGVLGQGSCWIKLSGPYRIAKSRPLSSVGPLGRALVSTRPDRLIWGSDWPHLPDGQRDTGELLNLLADWAPDEADRRAHPGRGSGPPVLRWLISPPQRKSGS